MIFISKSGNFQIKCAAIYTSVNLLYILTRCKSCTQDSMILAYWKNN